MFPYYGGKRRLAPSYPAPVFGTIIEPFAGSAAYSCQFPDHHVTLIERDAELAALWRYLVRATPDRIMALPVLGTADLAWGVQGLCDEERLLLTLFNGFSRATPRIRNRTIRTDAWLTGRTRVAGLVGRISHWVVMECNYDDAPDVRATWFIDPPYAPGSSTSGRTDSAGGAYAHGSDAIDYGDLAGWCRERSGQVIVCEYGSANWLPFRPFSEQVSSQNERQTELIWTQGPGNAHRNRQPV